jgi:DNA polymerase-3 subunit alpha
VAGIVSARRDRRSQRGNAYSFVTLSDATGQFDILVFSEALNQAGDLLEPGQAVVMSVEIDRQDDDLRLRAQSVRPIEEVAANTAAGLKIFLDQPEPLSAVRSRLSEKGRGAVSLVLMTEGREVEMELKERFHITPAIRGAIRSIPGVVEVQDV